MNLVRSTPFAPARLLGHLAAAFVLLLMTPFQPAWAQGNVTLAEALFDDAKREFDAGNYKKACAKFAESQRLDHATGTLLNLAICYEMDGRLATAWSTWREAASSARTAGQADRAQHAREMADKLDGQLARLTVLVQDRGSLPDGYVLTQDGVEQAQAAWGVALPVDAGTRHFEAKAPGYKTWSTEIEVTDGQSVSLSVPHLEPKPPTEAAPAKEPSSDQPSSTQSDVEDAPSRAPNILKIWGISLTGAGAATLAVGTYFGIRALNKNADSLDNCNEVDTNLCSRSGKSDRDAAITSANLANVLIGVGAAAATTGAVLLIVSGKHKDTSVALAPSPTGGELFLSGAF